MSMNKVANAAMGLAQQAVRSDAARRDPELLTCLSDLLVHLAVWRNLTGAAAYDQLVAATVTATAVVEDDDECLEPTVIVGDTP